MLPRCTRRPERLQSVVDTASDPGLGRSGIVLDAGAARSMLEIVLSRPFLAMQLDAAKVTRWQCPCAGMSKVPSLGYRVCAVSVIDNVRHERLALQSPYGAS